MKMVKRIDCIILALMLLSASCFAEVAKEDTRIVVSAKNEALILGVAVSLSVTDASTKSIVVLDDKIVEKDGTIEFDMIDLQKFKGLKVFETSITTYGYNEKDMVVLIQKDEDGSISQIISDTTAMPEEYLAEALFDLYDFFELTEILAIVPETEHFQLAQKIAVSAGEVGTEKEYKQMLTDEIILHTVENRLTEQIINSFEGILEVTEKLTNYNRLTSYQKETLFRNTAGESYSSVNALISALNAKITQLLETTSGNTGSAGSPSSSGKGSSGSKSGSSVTVPQPTVAPQRDPEQEESISYSDMESAKWAVEAVDYLSKLGIVNGYDDKTFRPNDDITRAEFLKMLVQLTNVSETGNNIFRDVSKNDWFYPYIIKAYSAGFARGDGRNFYPNDAITRQDMCVMCMNVLEYYGLKVSETELEFTDKDSVADYAKAALATLSEMRIVSGMSDGSFMPEKCATRAEAANIIYKIWNVLKGM